MNNVIENIFDRLKRIHTELEILLNLLDTAIQENKFYWEDKNEKK